MYRNLRFLKFPKSKYRYSCEIKFSMTQFFNDSADIFMLDHHNRLNIYYIFVPTRFFFHFVNYQNLLCLSVILIAFYVAQKYQMNKTKTWKDTLKLMMRSWIEQKKQLINKWAMLYGNYTKLFKIISQIFDWRW